MVTNLQLFAYSFITFIYHNLNLKIMKLKLISLMLFVQLCISGSVGAQCLNVGYENLNNKTTYKSTGVANLDNYLNIEKKYLEEIFRVKVDLKILDDRGQPNAYASKKSSNLVFFDGTVYLGYNLLNDEIENKNRGLQAVTGIMAHEFGHVLQEKLKCELVGPIRELHADFLAGFYMGIRKTHNSEEAISQFAESLFAKGDGELWDESHHGTPDQRVNAMLCGYVVSLTINDPKIAYEKGILILTNIGDNGDLGTKVRKAQNTNTTTPKTEKDEIFYTISFKVGNVDYYGLLLKSKDYNFFRVRFNDGSNEKIIQQRMTYKKTDKDISYIEGSNVINVVTKQTDITYSPDSFYFIKNDIGEFEIWNIDNKGNVGKCEFTKLESNTKINEWLRYLQWTN